MELGSISGQKRGKDGTQLGKAFVDPGLAFNPDLTVAQLKEKGKFHRRGHPGCKSKHLICCQQRKIGVLDVSRNASQLGWQSVPFGETIGRFG